MPAKLTPYQKVKLLCEKHSIQIDVELLTEYLILINKSDITKINTFFTYFMIDCYVYATKDIYDIIERYKIYKSCGVGVTLIKLCAKYGDTEGNIRWKSYCNKQAETNTFEYKQKKYGMTKEEFDEYNSGRAVTYENLIKRHGVKKGSKIWEEYCTKQAKSGCTLEYFIEKLGEDAGRQKYDEVCKLKGLNLQNFIRKYGETDGIIKFEKYLKNKNSCTSDMSQELFNDLYNKLSKEDQTHCYYSSLNYERFLYNLKETRFIDFCLENKKIIIEFNGNVYHANPKMYKENDVMAYRNMTAKEIWEYDTIKERLAHNSGYKMIVVWELDYTENKEATIQQLMEMINNESIKL